MRRGSFALTPAVITLFAVLAFLAVLNFAIEKPEVTNSTNTANGNTNATNGNANIANVNAANVNQDRTLVTNANVSTNTNTAVNSNTAVNTNTTTDLTAGWRTLSNSVYAYSFRYPAQVEVVGDYNRAAPESEQRVYINLVGSSDLVLDIQAFLSENYVEEFRAILRKPLAGYAEDIWRLNKEDPNPNFPSKEVSALSKITLNGIEAYEFFVTDSIRTAPDGSGFVIYAEHRVVLLAHGSVRFLMSSPKDVQLDDDILTTFTFTN